VTVFYSWNAWQRVQLDYEKHILIVCLNVDTSTCILAVWVILGGFFIWKLPMSTNPRWNSERRKFQARFRALGYPCALCGKPIDYELGMITDPRTGKRKPHPMSFVIDEITPLSRGGQLTWENSQPAHWICNARKGDGTRRKKHATARAALPQPWDM
jgi:hypothetical protein